jgi:hypothetical protein
MPTFLCNYNDWLLFGAVETLLSELWWKLMSTPERYITHPILYTKRLLS